MIRFLPFRLPSSTLLIQAVIAFAAGIAIAASGTSPPHFIFILIVFCLAAFLTQRQHLLSLPCILLFFFCIGWQHGDLRLRPPDEPASLYQLFSEPQEAVLIGTLAESPESGSGKTRFVMEVQQVAFAPAAPASGQVDLDSRPARGLIRLTLRGDLPDPAKPGDTLLVRARVSRPTRFNTPGSFDYPRYLAEKSIWATGWIGSPVHIRVMAPTSADVSFFEQLAYFPERVRHSIIAYLDSHLITPVNVLYRAILTGDRSGIPPDILENFKASGTMHLLAISGLHMGLIALGIGGLVTWLVKRSSRLLLHTPAWKIAALFTLPFLFCYALIAGLQTPVVRSLIMTSVFLAAIVLDRQWHIPTNIAIAALIILVVQPADLFTASFQLSFAAVIAMAAIVPFLRTLFADDPSADMDRQTPPRFTGVRRIVTGAFILSLAAQAGTLPLLLLYFNRFSTVSAVSTLFIEPLLCLWALTFGLVSCPFIFIAPAVADPLLGIGAWGIVAADHLTGLFAALPVSSVWLPTPGPAEIAAYYLLLFSIPLLRRKKVARFTALAGLAGLVLLPLISRIQREAVEADRVSFLDVGQGNCAVIELAGGYTALIDGGGPASERFNVGESVIAPYLWSRGIRRLDTIIVSHPDADHYNGLAFVVDHFRPDLLWINGDTSPNKQYEALIAVARHRKTVIRVPRAGEGLSLKGRAFLVNLTAGDAGARLLSENDRSLVVKLSSGEYDFLFSGDIAAMAEKELVERGVTGGIEVLLVPHHGSDSSSSEAFVQSMAPAYAVISAGKNKTDTFPSPQVVERYQNTGARVLNTARDGTVIFTVDRQGLSVTSWRGGVPFSGEKGDQVRVANTPSIVYPVMAHEIRRR